MISPPSLGKGLDIAGVAQDLLDHVIRHWERATPGTAVPLPERRLVAPGDPRTIAWDCEQLTISLEGIGFGPAVDISASPSPRAGISLSVNSLRHAVLTVSVVRCTPQGGEDGTPPSMGALHAAGLTYLRDCGLLSQAVVTFAGIMRAELDDTESVQCGAVTPFGPSGGFHSADCAMAITTPTLV